MSETSVKDRRVHERHDTEFTVHGPPDEGGVVARMVARNLSLGGLYCTSSKDFEEMTRLAVRLLLPGGDNGTGPIEPVDLEAVVVRREKLAEAVNGDERYRLALFFTQLEPDARTRLTRYLDRR